MDRPDDLIKASEAARLLGVSTHAVRIWLRQGRIPAVQYGPRGIYRVRRGDVLAFMEASRIARDGGRAGADRGAEPEPDAP
jgi:excisionase family DNA binding protein